MWNKRHFSSSLKNIQLPEIVPSSEVPLIWIWLKSFDASPYTILWISIKMNPYGDTIIFKHTKLTEWVAAKWYKVYYPSILVYFLSIERCNQVKQISMSIIMLKKRKVYISKQQDLLIDYSKVSFNISHFKKAKRKYLSLIFSLLFLNVWNT